MGVDALPVAGGLWGSVSGWKLRASERLSHLNGQSRVSLVVRPFLSMAPQPQASVTGSPTGGGQASRNPVPQLEACLSAEGD